MGTRLYPLPDRDGDGRKVRYPLDLGMGMRMNFFYGDRYGIAKPIPALPRCHPYEYFSSLNQDGIREGMGIRAEMGNRAGVGTTMEWMCTYSSSFPYPIEKIEHYLYLEMANKPILVGIARTRPRFDKESPH